MVCATPLQEYSSDTKIVVSCKEICHLNNGDEEAIKSIFFNEPANSILTISVHSHDNFTSLSCKTYPISGLKKGQVGDARFVFDSESLVWPSFVEFDLGNQKILTFSDRSKLYRVWDMGTYQHQYDIYDPHCKDIRFGLSLLVMLHPQHEKAQPILIFDIDTGQLVDKLVLPMSGADKLEVITAFRDRLMIKRTRNNFEIIDLTTRVTTCVEDSRFSQMRPLQYLFSLDLMLMQGEGKIEVWDASCQVRESWDDCLQDSFLRFFPRDNLLVYHGAMSRDERDTMGVVIHDLARGRRWLEADCCCLSQVTSSFYCCEQREIYLGDSAGTVHLWS